MCPDISSVTFLLGQSVEKKEKKQKKKKQAIDYWDIIFMSGKPSPE